MQVSKWILTGAAICLVVVLYLLPKVVVDNEKEAAASAIGTQSGGDVAEAHDRQLAETEAKKIKDFKEDFKSRNNTEKSASFADSLAGLFASFNYLDSAAFYYGQAADLEPGMERLIKAGNGYFEAFNYAVDLQKQRYFGEACRKYLNSALSQDSGLYDAKAKIALTYLPQETMQAVLLLREVVQSDPLNKLALYNLGLLSVQSRQFDKAIERFEKLVNNYPDHLEGQFYLGVAYYESGARDQARSQFQRVKKMDSDPEVQSTVDEYLKELK